MADSSLRPLQCDFFAGAAGAVYGVYDLQGLVAFFTGDQRLAAARNGVAEIAELALERIERNRHRVGGSRDRRRGHRGGLAGIVLYVPDGEPVAGNHRRALRAVELRALGIAGPHRRGGLDRKSTRLNSSHLGISYA